MSSASAVKFLVPVVLLCACASLGSSVDFYCEDAPPGGASTWYMIAGDEEIVVTQDTTHGPFTAYVGSGGSNTVDHIARVGEWRSGAHTEVAEVSSDGWFIYTTEGVVYEVEQLDRAETSSWLPGSVLLIREDNLVAYNLDHIRKIAVYRLCPGISPTQIRRLSLP